MKILSILSLSLLPLICTPQVWQQSQGPTGGYVYCLTSSANKIYAGTNAGVYVSSDFGASWKPINNGLPQTLNVRTLAINDSNLVIATDYGIYYSTNNGITWHAPTSQVDLICLTVVGKTFFGGAFDGVYKSTDQGAHWISSSNGIPENSPPGNTDVYALHLFKKTLVASTGIGICISDTSGNNWTPLNVAATPQCFASNTNVLYAGASNVLMSIDTGRHWTPISGSLNVRFMLATDSILYVATSTGIYLTNDNGANWQMVNSGLGELSIQSLAVCGGSLFTATGVSDQATQYFSQQITGNIYRSNNLGALWICVSNRLADLTSSAVVSIGSLLVVGTMKGVFVSYDAGQTWISKSNGLGNLKVNSLFLDGGILYAGTQGGGIYTSGDSAKNWTSASVGLNTYNQKQVRHFTKQENYVLAGTPDGVFASNNGGNNWIKIDNSWTGSYPTISMTVLGRYLFQGVNDGLYLYRFTGSSWVFEKNLFTELRWPNALAAHAGNVFIARDDGIYMSADSGMTWTASNNGCSGAAYCLYSSGPALYTGTLSDVYYTTDKGVNWHSVGNGISQMEPYSLCAANGQLYAATNGGVWSNSAISLSVPQYSTEARASAFPNPAHDNLFIDDNSSKEVLIVDAMGKIVLIAKREEGKPIYIGPLPVGLYLVRSGNLVAKFVKE